VDLWSIGVIVYILLCGFPPFYGDNDNQMFKKIKAGQYKFLAPYWDPISAEAKDFVSKLLVVNRKERMDCDQALKHPWIKPLPEKQVSTRNLFEKKKTDAEGGSDSARGSADEGAHGDETDLHSMFTNFNIDRKTANLNKLRRNFDFLPEDTQLIDKLKCSYGSTYGKLYLTLTHICFLPGMGTSKKVWFETKEITTLKKMKRYKFTPGKGAAIAIVTKDGEVQFNGFAKRDLVFDEIAKLAPSAKKEE